MRSVYEIQREGNSLIIWEAGVGHRVIFESDTMAILQEDKLLADERRFHQAKTESGVYVIESFGDLCSPYELIRRYFKAWRSPVARHLGIVIYENTATRPTEDYW